MKELNINGYTETIIERSDYPQEKCKDMLDNEVTAILGYGPQGYGQGMNMRDQGFNVMLGLRRGSSWEKAVKDGWVEGENLFESAEASFELILQKRKGAYKPFFEVLESRVNVHYDKQGNSSADAMLKVKVDGEIEHTAADGNGPVNALNNAIKKALVRFFPELEQVKLTDYKVRVLNEQDGTSVKVRVLIESSDGNESWSTIGVSENIIEASWEALRDSFNYRLFKIQNSKKELSLIDA